MRLLENFQGALFNIMGAKLRSLLAVLGILIGTASVVALVMSGELATQHALQQFKVLGTNLLSVSVFQQNQEKNKGSGVKQEHLSLQQARDSGKADQRIRLAAPYTMVYSQTFFNDKNITATAIGATENLQKVIKIKMQAGRFVSFLDKRQYFAVVGSDIAKRLKQAGAKTIIGNQIAIDKNIFTIIGIAKPWPQNNFFEQNINDSIIIPLQTSLSLNKYTAIQNVVYRIEENVDIEAIKTHLSGYFNRYISGGRVYVRSPEQIIKSMNKQQNTFTTLLGVIGGISLLVGGIGVMNIMLVSVVERRREIGIRRAIGAKQSNIRNLFLAESVTLSLFGGIVGVIVGVIASVIIAKVSDWQFVFFPMPAIIGFAVSVFVGVFFGYYPAYRASKLNPIELLRSE